MDHASLIPDCFLWEGSKKQKAKKFPSVFVVLFDFSSVLIEFTEENAIFLKWKIVLEESIYLSKHYSFCQSLRLC